VTVVPAELNVTYTLGNTGHLYSREQDLKFLTLIDPQFTDREFLIGAPKGCRDHFPEFDSAGTRSYREDRKGVPLDFCHRLGQTYKIIYALKEEDLMLYLGDTKF
jgi:hypothetical protein